MEMGQNEPKPKQAHSGQELKPQNKVLPKSTAQVRNDKDKLI